MKAFELHTIPQKEKPWPVRKHGGDYFPWPIFRGRGCFREGNFHLTEVYHVLSSILTYTWFCLLGNAHLACITDGPDMGEFWRFWIGFDSNTPQNYFQWWDYVQWSQPQYVYQRWCKLIIGRCSMVQPLSQSIIIFLVAQATPHRLPINFGETILRLSYYLLFLK